MAGKKEDTIKTTISVDGEKEYKQACKEISGALRELGSEMKLVDAQFADSADSAEALTKKQDILNKEIVEYEKKLSAAEKALKEMEESGENNEEAMRRMRIEINRAKTSLANTQTELRQMERSLEQAADGADEAEDEFEDLGDALEKLDGATDGANDDLAGLGEALGGLGGPIGEAADMLGGLQDKLSAFGVNIPALMNPATIAIAGIGAALGSVVVESVKFSAEVDKALTQFENKTGIAADESSEFKDALFDVYKYGLGESVEDVADAMATVAQATGETDPEKISELASAALTLRDTFDMDVAESIRSAQQLMTTFGVTGEEAFDTIAKATQLGLDKDGNLLDTINEYAVHYKQLGLDMDDMFNSLINAKEAGVFDLDKAGDAIKEFGIRVREGADETKEALKDLGLNANEVISAINEGGPAAAAAMQLIVTALNSIEDPVERNRIGVALFGSMWEDLGASGVAAVTSINGALGEAEGAIASINEADLSTIEGAMTNLGRTIEVALEPIGSFFESRIPAAINGFTAQLETLPDLFENVWKAATGAGEWGSEEQSFGDYTYKADQSSAGALWDVTSNIDWGGMVDKAIGNIKSFFGIEGESGPATVTIPIGESAMQGIATGFDNEAPTTEETLVGLASSMVESGTTTMTAEAPTIGEAGIAALDTALIGGQAQVDGTMSSVISNTAIVATSTAQTQMPGVGMTMDTSLGTAITSNAALVTSSVDGMMLESVNTAMGYGPQFNAAGAQVPSELQAGMASGMGDLEAWLNAEMTTLSKIAMSGLADINTAVAAAQAAIDRMPEASGGSGGTSVTQNFYGTGSGGYSGQVRDARLEAQILARTGG